MLCAGKKKKDMHKQKFAARARRTQHSAASCIRYWRCTFLIVSMQLGFAMLEVGCVRQEHRMTVLDAWPICWQAFCLIAISCSSKKKRRFLYCNFTRKGVKVVSLIFWPLWFFLVLMQRVVGSQEASSPPKSEKSKIHFWIMYAFLQFLHVFLVLPCCASQPLGIRQG